MSDALERLRADADRLAARRRRVPGATYRLQMHAGFTLADAERIAPYLHSLGITHVYTSPVLAAKPGSTHGYDVIDFSRLNPEIGSEGQLQSWVAGLRKLGMGWILDTVPNHMSVGGPNEWWADVLEHGQASAFADYFDIAWNDHPRQQLHGKVLLPILPNPFGEEIDAGRFRVQFQDGAFAIDYAGMRLPIDPRTYGVILTPMLEALRGNAAADDPDINELQSIATAVRNLPPRSAIEKGSEASAEARIIKQRLQALTGRNPAVAQELQAALRRLNGVPGEPATFQALEEFLEAQAYRPSYWRVASDEINYRRFFDINDLAALSTEREDVFVAMHRKIFAWVQAGWLDGLRIDHPDGLYNPKQYLDRLQIAARLASANYLLANNPQDYDGIDWATALPALRQRFAATTAKPLYVVVEKILTGAEQLPREWATDGTTGYEFINLLNGLFVDPAGEAAMSRTYRDLVGFDGRFDQLVYSCKFQILQTSLASEMHVLAHQLDRLAQAARWSRDFTLNGLRHALREVIACFPVYRSYINGGVADQDRQVVLRAVARARRKSPLLGGAIFNYIRDTLLLKDPPSGPATPEYRAAQQHFAGKFQQVTAPTMAKGFEDTALYVYARLIALNEVGGDPAHFGRGPGELHRAFADRAERTAGALSPLTTHDTKRAEDVRARIDVLSEMPEQWSKRVALWMEVNRRHKIDLGEDEIVPDANEEYFLYQSLVGAWPIGGLNEHNRPEFVARIQAYLIKSLHEAKVHTSWINSNPEYEAAAKEFVAKILDLKNSTGFLGDFEQFQGQVSTFGMYNSLAQTLARVAAPGVPDTYQGTELWDFSLVDPDNRRSVDFESRARMLQQLDERAASDPLALVRNLMEQIADGRIKLYVLSRALRCRRDRLALFSRGSYRPVEASGPRSEAVFAFLRQTSEDSVLVAVPRLIARLPSPPIGAETWREMALMLPDELRGTRWRNIFTNEAIALDSASLPVGRLFARLPVSMLAKD